MYTAEYYEYRIAKLSSKNPELNRRILKKLKRKLQRIMEG